MKFSVIKTDVDPARDKIAEALVQKFLEHGHELVSPENGIRFVLNLTGTDHPTRFRRHSQGIFIFTLVAVAEPPQDLRTLAYTTLIRTLSNMVLCAVPDGEIYFATPEAGFYHLPFDPEEVYRRMAPIAGAHFAIGNRLTTDLPSRFWETSPVVEQIKEYGRALDALGVLPTPFPLRNLLSEEGFREIYRLFEMRGLSYGNLSARESVPELGGTTYWMTARGIDKGRVTKVGRDVLLVRGFDYQAGQALVSVPPDHDEKARVSVDAVEHELIYRRFPGVGAIVHVHAWLDGVPCTGQNYPCGTIELARDVADLLGRTEDPARTAVGLKNHGVTITGPSLSDIFDRIRGRLRTEVRMVA